ncbi:MAG: metalloenzyme [Myxococcaceae bacterium]|nr:metalloenzyme [Myxococcaceae bacterium]
MGGVLYEKRVPPPSKVALLFIDGVGVGARDEAANPLTAHDFLLSQFEDGSGAPLPRGGQRHDVDTTFGVPGRPQSATNQTAMLTGLPAPRLLGEHVLGYPTRPLAKLLADASIVKALLGAGRSVTFANAYPVGYLDALGLARRPGSLGDFVMPDKLKRRLKPSATTLAFTAGEVPLRTFDDAVAGRGLTHDIDGAAAQRRFPVPRRTPEEAAAIFWALAEDFTLFEHHLADEAGHAQDRGAALDALRTFDRFAREIVRLMPDDAQVLICSDHGNVEDLSTRNHTTNRVAALSFGAQTPALSTVADVGRQIVAWLERP